LDRSGSRDLERLSDMLAAELSIPYLVMSIPGLISHSKGTAVNAGAWCSGFYLALSWKDDP
jgi:hypothetical protein